MLLIGKIAPDFLATAVVAGGSVVEEFTLSQFRGKYVILFFYPLDFTFVCPTELMAFQDKYKEFKALNCEIIGCSRDSHYTHLAWLSTPKLEGGIQGVIYPLVADMTLEISKNYGVLKQESGVSYRGLFLIDKEGIVRHCLVNDLPLGRSVDEAVRILQALQHFEKEGEVCPANWKEGGKGFKANKEDLEKYISDQ
jgi:peroxiredoxin (alkyl hydroperoxide reductase subunit C)